jgi:predicted permease
MLDDLARDLRFAFRTFAKSPVFTTVAVLSLALGIGANTAIFTFADQILLRLLPVRNPQELVQARMPGGRLGSNNGDGLHTFSHPLYLDLRAKNDVFSGVMARYPTRASLTAGDSTDLVVAELVSGNYFEVLGVGAAVGRTFTLDDDKNPGAHPVAVLSYRYWSDRFNRDPSILGKAIQINGQPFNVVGVSQAGFDGIDMGVSASIRVPMAMKLQLTPLRDDLKNRRSAWLHIFGRLRPGVSIDQARASIAVLYDQIRQQELQEPFFSRASEFARKRFLDQKFELIPAAGGMSSLRRQFERPLQVLMAIVGLVLLIACANVANLLLARAASRQKEIAVRFSLGASRWQVVRQLLLESVLLGFAGAAAGLLLSSWICKFLLQFIPAGIATLTLSTTPDVRILTFTASIALLTGLLFGLAPAMQSTRASFASVLKDQAGSVVGGAGHIRTRKILVISQVALSLVLLAGSGLFIRSLANLKSVDPGFPAERLITFDIAPGLNGYAPEQRAAFFRQLQDRLKAMPGVRAAGFARNRLFTGGRWDSNVTVEGYESKPGEDINPYFNAVSPGYLEAMGIPLLAGRDFTPADAGENARVAIVNQKFVDYFFKGGNAIGRRFATDSGPGTVPDIEIIGVIGNTKYTGVREELQRQVLLPYLRLAPFTIAMTVYVRTGGEPEAMFSAIRSEIRAMDPNLPVFEFRTLETQISNSLVNDRLVASLSAGFGFLATILAAIGLYGVLAFVVASRTREMGIRMALGALRGNILWIVMREVLLLAGIGIGIGLAAALALTRLVQSQLYQTAPTDPLSMSLALAGIAFVAGLAGYVPALRASRVDPVQALRYE